MTLLESVPNRRRLGWQAVWFALWVTLTTFGLGLHANPAGHGTHRELGLPPCPVVVLLNRPCPGCGLTTSWTALLHGQFSFAFHAHPLGPVLYVLFTLSALLALYGFIRCERVLIDSPQMSRALTVGTMIFLAFGFARMALTPNFGTPSEHLYSIVKRPL